MFNFNDKIAVYALKYIKGSRRPGFKGKFTKKYLGNGILLPPTSILAHFYPNGNVRPGSNHLIGKTEQEIQEFFNNNLALNNATGKSEDGLTEGNNCVLFNGETLWVYREQIGKPK